MSIRLSYTANEMYQQSPRAYYLHYLLKLRPKQTGSALVFGSAIDNALNALLEKRFFSKDLDPKAIFLDSLREVEINGQTVKLDETDLVKYSKADNDSSIWTPEDFKSKERPELVTLRRKGLLMLDAYEEQVLPHISELIASQRYVEIKNPEGDKIVGFVDLIARFSPKGELYEKYKAFDGKLIIFDNKTTSIKYKEDSVYTSRQLGTYSQSPTITQEIEGCGYIVIPKKFRKEKKPLIPIEIIVDKVSDDTVRSIFKEYESTLQGIKTGNFPCTQNCLKSPFGCNYETYCKSNGQDLKGLIYVGEAGSSSKSRKT